LYIAKCNYTTLDRIIFVLTDENASFVRVNLNNVHYTNGVP